jgi:hypothetical protein
MKEPVDHIERPLLPWRELIRLTECGYAADKVKTITRDQFMSRLLEYGQHRTAILTCMTCMETARRWGTWDQDPCQALQRELQWDLRHREDLLKRELLAVAMLIRLHTEEFKALVKDAELWAELKRP